MNLFNPFLPHPKKSYGSEKECNDLSLGCEQDVTTWLESSEKTKEFLANQIKTSGRDLLRLYGEAFAPWLDAYPDRDLRTIIPKEYHLSVTTGLDALSIFAENTKSPIVDEDWNDSMKNVPGSLEAVRKLLGKDYAITIGNATVKKS